MKFLSTPEQELDVGFSLPFQSLALSHGAELYSRAWLLSDAVQLFLEEVAISFFAHSLAAERKAAQSKRREQRHVSLLANVSRDLLCTQFTTRQAAQAKVIADATTRLTKLKRSGWSAIAWETAPPVGQRITKESRSSNMSSLVRKRAKPQAATGGHRPQAGPSSDEAKVERARRME